MAEFLQILSEQYDYPQLADEVLRELSNKEFNSNDNKGPKSISAFFVKLSELAPRLVNKQMTSLVKLLDSEVKCFQRDSLLHIANVRAVIYSEMCHHRSLWKPYRGFDKGGGAK
jgi:hypothetical protein